MEEWLSDIVGNPLPALAVLHLLFQLGYLVFHLPETVPHLPVLQVAGVYSEVEGAFCSVLFTSSNGGRWVGFRPFFAAAYIHTVFESLSLTRLRAFRIFKLFYLVLEPPMNRLHGRPETVEDLSKAIEMNVVSRISEIDGGSLQYQQMRFKFMWTC